MSDIRTSMARVSVAIRLPATTPLWARCASTSASNSVRNLNWLKKKGRASVGGVRSRWNSAVVWSSVLRSVALTIFSSAQQHRKFISFGGVLERCERCRRERRLRHDQCRHVSRRRQEQVAPGLGDAVRKQGRDGKADHSAGLVHFATRVPAAHREQAVRVEPAEKALPGLDRVKTVFREREGAGAGRRPGIDEAHLDDVAKKRGVRANLISPR